MFLLFFVKFLGWIVASWARIARLIREAGGLRFWKEGPITKIKYIISKKKKQFGPGRLGSPPRFVPDCP